MLNLYIAGQLVDLSDDVAIALTYQSTDLETPTVTKNTFSKSITLWGTPTNNLVFGNIWKLDHHITSGDYTQGGIFFDPKKRVDFVLEQNADIVERGYLQLNTISVENNVVKYSMTLYGGIGDFFYNLMYDASGNTMSLADLYYGWKDASGNVYTREEERTNKLIKWNSAYISSSWSAIKYGVTTDTIKNWITAVPTYSGLYDDFDSNKVLCNVGGFQEYEGYDPIRPYMPSQKTQDGSTYSITEDGYAIITAERDMVEWEVRDLRSQYQRPAIKFQAVAEAISNPENNGGYSVEWDASILESEYYTKSYIMFDRIKFEESSETELHNISYDSTPAVTPTEPVVNNIGISGLGSTYDIPNPAMYINNNGKYTIAGVPAGSNVYTSYATYMIVGGLVIPIFVIGGYLVRYEYTYGSYHSYSPYYFQTTGLGKYGDIDFGGKTATDYAKTLLAEKYGTMESNIIVTESELLRISDTDEFVFNPPMHISMNLPITQNQIEMKCTMEAVNFVYDPTTKQFITGSTNFDYSVLTKNDSDNWIIRYDSIELNMQSSSYEGVNDKWVDSNGNLINAYFDINELGFSLNNHIGKDVLLGGTKTPYDYLIGFTKQLNLRFRIDPPVKKVYIEPMTHYYKDELIDMTEKIDYNKAYTINPTLMNYKWYEYGLDTPESYASNLYNRKYPLEYGHYKFDSGYQFNADVKKLHEGLAYQNVVPYRMKGQLFNIIHTNLRYINIPQCVLPSKYTYTLWNASGESKDFDMLGYMATNPLANAYDAIHRLCCFDSDNGNMSDISACFVFYTGQFDSVDDMYLTDNLLRMAELNNGKACYIYTPSEKDKNNNYIAKSVKYNLPIFDRTCIDTNRYSSSTRTLNKVTSSWDFVLPKASFMLDSVVYDKSTTLYERYWKNYITDLYDTDSKSVECYCVIEDNPREALRKFYTFDNCVWVLNKITDYNPDVPHTPVKCVFAKVKDYQNYLK